MLIRFKTSQGVPVGFTIEDNIRMKADVSAMTSVIINLVENAYKYSPKNSEIDVQLFQKENEVFFIVKDEGVGIKEADKEKIFDKFYRVGNEDTRATKGTGLGLFIVKEVVVFHNGSIKLKPNKPKGSIFEVKFQL